MKEMLKLTRLAVPSIVGVALLLTGCAVRNDAHPPGRAVILSHETAEQIKTMKPCKAIVVSTHGCYAVLRTTRGREFTIGSPGNTAELNGFVGDLKEGQAYSFPDAFLLYQKQHHKAECILPIASSA